jgi:hypothetical protein
MLEAKRSQNDCLKKEPQKSPPHLSIEIHRAAKAAPPVHTQSREYLEKDEEPQPRPDGPPPRQ